MKENDEPELKCISCGHSAYFEPNYDRSYIMCMYCFKEYRGGYEELYQLNKGQKPLKKMDKATQLK
ncbi:MAG: hypothetical protein ACM3P1_08400 [Candidatus Saccharibacteria bacterium]